MNKYHILLPVFLLMIISCQRTKSQQKTITVKDTVIIQDQSVTEPEVLSFSMSSMAQHFDSLGLVDMNDYDPSIAVHLVYATADNFTGEILYDDLWEAYLHPEAAKALVKAQAKLKELHPRYSLIVYDATRPMSVQQKMWNLVKGTSKNIYVSNPARGGGLHNYGLAVDVTIIDETGTPLPMGTEYDHFGYEAHINNEQQLVNNGIITAQELENRLLLRNVMRQAGYRALNSEWWHFNFRSRDEARRNYKLIE